MGTKIAAHTDHELLEWIVQLDDVIRTIQAAEEAFGMLTHETANRVRAIQREVLEEIGHRTTLGNWTLH